MHTRAFLAVSSHILNTFAVPTRSPSANIQPSPEIYSRNQPQRSFGWFYVVLENLECIFYRVHWLSLYGIYHGELRLSLYHQKPFRVNRISDIDSYSPVHVSCPSLFTQRCRSISAKTTPRLLTRLWLFFTEPNRTAIKLRQRLFLPYIQLFFTSIVRVLVQSQFCLGVFWEPARVSTGLRARPYVVEVGIISIEMLPW